MEKIDLRIHVNPSGVNPMDLEDFNPTRDGKIMSTADKININKSATGYSVVYESNVFNTVDKALLMANLVKIFKTNLPNCIVDLGICYNFETEEEYEFDYETFGAVMDFNSFCKDIVNTNRVDNLVYTETDSIENLIEFYETHFNNETEYDDEGDEEPTFDENSDPTGILAALYGMESDEKKKKKHKKSKEYYGRSRVWKNAKNAKRAVKRHGVVIADDKDDIKKDEKILKEFLKDFLPGSASWQKDFRSDVLKRFINMYAVSKKNLKRLEKQHKKNRRKKYYNNIDTDKALDFTRRLLNVPVDRWNDPTK